jgi:hypothetical protein
VPNTQSPDEFGKTGKLQRRRGDVDVIDEAELPEACSIATTCAPRASIRSNDGSTRLRSQRYS